ncbi:MAG: dockerin type I domain-containing protein [Pseudomonadota bacterium]
MTKFLVFALTSIALATSSAASQQSSANYRIDWDVVDASGVPMSSANYTVIDSPAQPSALGESTSANYRLTPGFLAAPDTDTDAILDFMDNCTLDPNASQYDSNGDGYGNVCDPDLDNNGSVNFVDYSLMIDAFLSSPGAPNWNPDADLTGDNVVNFIDIARFQLFFLGPPGPSGND